MGPVREVAPLICQPEKRKRKSQRPVGGRGIKHKTVLLKNVISGLSGPAGEVKVILREMSKS